MAASIQHGVAAQRLAVARWDKAAGERLPPDCRPGNIEDALEIQRLVRLLVDEPVGAWKCSLSGPVVFAAPIYAPDIFTGSPCPVIAEGGFVQMEPEIAFVLGRDLPPRDSPNSESEIDAAINETRLVLELVGGHFAEPDELSFPELLADHLSNQGLVVGPVVSASPFQIAGAISISVESSGVTVIKRDGRHPWGHPIRAFRALVQALAKRGEYLNKGQVFITGSYAGVLKVSIAESMQVRFGDIGVMDVEFCSGDPGMTKLGARHKSWDQAARRSTQ